MYLLLVILMLIASVLMCLDKFLNFHCELIWNLALIVNG